MWYVTSIGTDTKDEGRMMTKNVRMKMERSSQKEKRQETLEGWYGMSVVRER